jgi:uncharacterized GH25 family protein
MKRVLAGFLLLVAAAPAIAHDFWIEPARFGSAPGAALPITFQVGHGAHRQRWGLNTDRITLLTDISSEGRRDRRAELRRGGPADLVVRFQSRGVHVLAMQSTHAFSELPAARFNAYLQEEGLALIRDVRQRAGQTRRPGRERYSRRAKALIQVGQATAANQAPATRPVGLTLEIVPDRNPFALGPSRSLPVHVLYKGRRLANATVKLTNLGADQRPVATAVTNKTGRATFRVPARGRWLLNVVWGEPVSGDPKADYDTTFSSLTFGYDG